MIPYNKYKKEKNIDRITKTFIQNAEESKLEIKSCAIISFRLKYYFFINIF